MKRFRHTHERFLRHHLFVVLWSLALGAPSMNANPPQNNPASPHWISLPSLPDPIGFSGMAAGVLDERLVATGGSQWDQPVWLKGSRNYNDQIYVLGGLDQQWQITSTRLPVKAGHFATAATGQAIYLAGGIDAGGCLASVYELRAQDGSYVFRRLADLPKAIGYAAGAIAGYRLFVIGGVPDPASREPSREVWSLDLSSSATRWEQEADLPGAGVLASAASSNGSAIFVFGGMAYDAAGKPAPSNSAYHLPKAGGVWDRLPDLPQPRVGGISPCPVLAGGNLWLIGGYAEVFGGVQREHPGFCDETLVFNLERRTWSAGPTLPHGGEPNRDLSGDPGPAPMLGAPAVIWQNHVVIVGGEVRISTRTPAVIAWPVAR